jgi:DNA-3-methyladenine glycosylase
VVAKDLLGKYLVRKIGDEIRAGKIVEIEAYIGPEDKASHAYGGKVTARNKAEFMLGGHVYIYLVYGMYWQLNLSTSREGRPECVLIRALEPLADDKSARASLGVIRHRRPYRFTASSFVKQLRHRKMMDDTGIYTLQRLPLTNGPGKLCKWLKLNKSFYGEDVTTSKRFWVEDRGVRISKSQIANSARIGIDYAGSYWASRLWRFHIKDSPYISKA